MKKIISLTLVFILTAFLPELCLAQAANQYASNVYLITDTALADGSDEIEIDVYLVDLDFSPITQESVYCATDRPNDSIYIGPNEEGWIRITITSDQVGSAKFAVSLASNEAAQNYLAGTGNGTSADQIVQIDREAEIGQIYFTAGSLDEDSSYFEFDEDTIVVTGGDYADFIQAKLFLRTEIDQPVPNQYLSLSSDLEGVTIWPASLITNSQGEAEFRISSTSLGDAEIIANVEELLISEYVTFDTPENIYEIEDPDWFDEEEEEEEPELVISPVMTKVVFNKLMAKEHGSNANYGESTAPTDWDRIIVSGIALTEDEEPVKGPSKVNAYATAGELNKIEPATTSTAGAFSFALTSAKATQGKIAVGLGTPEELKEYLAGNLTAEQAGLIKSQAYYFGSRNLDKFLLCFVDQIDIVENGIAKTLEVAPFIEQGRTMLALRPIADTIGAKLLWDNQSQTATIIHDKKELKITIGQETMTKAEYNRIKQIELDFAPYIIEGRSVFPLRSVAEAFDLTVDYQAADQSICIYNEKNR